MLVECGYVQASDGEGGEWSFLPSLARIAALGHPQEIVALYAGLFGERAPDAARFVLAVLCEQNDPLPLLGWSEPDAEDEKRLILRPGLMPEAEQVLIARHLMQHGICGRQRPGDGGGGEYSDRFEASQYVATARVHLGMSATDAERLSMSELQLLLETKFPQTAADIPEAEEYEQVMSMVRERSNG